MYAEGARHIGHCLVTLDGPGSLFCLDESRHCLMHCKEGSVFSRKMKDSTYRNTKDMTATH